MLCYLYSVQRVLAERVVRLPPGGAIPLSDHYGVEVTITVPAVPKDKPSGGGCVIASSFAALLISLLSVFDV